jgi:hypothetical protein
MGYVYVENENKNDKKPAASKPSAERSTENWAYNQQLLEAGVTSPVQKSFQFDVIEFLSTYGMAKLSNEQYNSLTPEQRKLRENVNPGRPNAVFDYNSALELGITEEDIVNFTLEDLVEREVRLLAVNWSVASLAEVVGGGQDKFRALTKRDDAGTTATTIHRDSVIVVFTDNADLLFSLEPDENAEARLATLRSNATDNANGSIFLAFFDPKGNRCLAAFVSLRDAATGTGITNAALQWNAKRGTLDKLGKKQGVSIQRLKDRSEYEALVPIENGTEELKKIIAKNTKVSPKNNPALKEELKKIFAKNGTDAKDKTALLNAIWAEFKYPVESQKELFRSWGMSKTKEEKKTGTSKTKDGNIKSYFLGATKTLGAKMAAPTKMAPAKKSAPVKKSEPTKKKSASFSSSDASFSSSDGSDSEVEMISAPVPARERILRTTTAKKATYVDESSDDDSD